VALQRRGRQPESPPQWLEGELREAKARLHKVEQELDQALKRVWSLDADLRNVMETLSATGAAIAALPGLKEDLRQLREQIGRVQDRQTAIANRAEEAFRRNQAEAERDRQEIATLINQLEALARGIAQYEGRFQALDEASRHAEEGVAGIHLAHRDLARDLGELSSHSARSLEATVRLEHELSRTAGEIEALRKEDEALSERLKLEQEQGRRQSERLDKLETIAAFPQEARELLHKATFERGQLAERLAAVERASNELTERVQEFVQGLARLDQRGQAQATQLLAMAEELREINEQTKGQIRRLLQAIIRQRRRQAEALTQEIKELSQGGLASGE